MTGGNISILNGIKTGNFSRIAANSHFLSDIIPYMIIEENPANKIKQRFPDEISIISCGLRSGIIRFGK